jgi:opacity protein-like surface antigen
MGRALNGRWLASAAVAALIVAGPAGAADLPLKAPKLVAPAWTWSGFYLGGHGGYGWSRDTLASNNDPFFAGKAIPNFGPGGFDSKGWLAGFHAGANWQDGRIVGGLEIDLSATGIKGSSTATRGPLFEGVPLLDIRNASAASSGRFEWLGSARGRVGFLATPDILVYGTGGLAWTQYVHDENLLIARELPFVLPPKSDGQFSNISSANWRFGWVAGIGAEARLFNSNWLARLEYLHYDFGNLSQTVTAFSFPGFGPAQRTGGDLTADIVRVGLTYKFDPDRAALGFTGADGPLAPVPYVKARPLAAVPWTWAGFYLGAHGGYGWGDDPFSNRLPLNGVPLSGVKSSGSVAGFHAGANWQSRSVVGGLELDISGADIKGTTSNAVGATVASQTDKFDRLGSVRARLGYLVTPGILLYGTGGLGWTQFTTAQDTPGTTPTPFITPNWLFGWVGGFGLEGRIGDSNWLARLEYLHYDFGNSGSFSQFTPAGALVTSNSSGHLTADLVRAGLSYKLNWPDVGGAGRNAMNAMAAMPPVAPVWSWSGFYAGGHGGYGWGKDQSQINVDPGSLGAPPPPPTVLTGVDSQGYVAGFQAGANWQSKDVVGGLEIDLSKTGIKGSTSAAGVDSLGAPIAGTLEQRFDLVGSVRARLGYLVRPDLLLYGTGGLAWTRLEQTQSTANPSGRTIASTPTWRGGWTAGGGGELRLWNSNWLARLEYLHYDFGRSRGDFEGFYDSDNGGINPVTRIVSGRVTADVVRAGIGYKFD